MKRILSVFLLLAMTVCLVSCDVVVTVNDVFPHTDYDGVYIFVSDIDMSDGAPVLKVCWVNQSSHKIGFGLGYDIERLVGEEWKSVKITDFAIPEMWCMLDPSQTGIQSYRTKYFNILMPGLYRIKTEFIVYDGVDTTTNGTCYAKFKIGYSN